jgi:hypothetical protein
MDTGQVFPFSDAIATFATSDPGRPCSCPLTCVKEVPA